MLLKRYNINIETRHSPSASIKKKKVGHCDDAWKQDGNG